MNRMGQTIGVIALLLCTTLALATAPQQGTSSRKASMKATSAVSLNAAKAAQIAKGKPVVEPAKVVAPFNTTAVARATPRQGGDTCAGAFPIPSLPFDDTGTTVGYNNDYDEVCPYTGSTSPDVAYVFTPATDVTVDVSLCNDGTNYDTKLYIYQGACPGTLVACNDDSCNSPQFPSSYVSRLNCFILTGGQTYYLIVDGYGGASGQYHLTVTDCSICTLHCPPDTLYGQPPSTPSDAWSAATSAVTTALDYTVYENFTAATGWFQALYWWGLSLHFSGGWTACDPTGMTFEVKFYQPGVQPGVEVSSYTVTPVIVDTGIQYAGYTMFYFSVPYLLPPPLLADGWISVKSQMNPSDCAFLWMSARSGLDGHSWQQTGTGPLADYAHDDSFCLSPNLYVPSGACCNDATGTCTDNIEMIDCLGPGMRFALATLCADLNPPCGQAPGACCHPDGTCDITVPGACPDNWLGPNTTCATCPCIVPCPPGATPEPEACGDDTDGGCNMAVPTFAPLAIGETICGTAWFDGSTRDTDWYEIVLTPGMILTLRGRTEFQALTGFLEQRVPGVPGCDNVTGYLNPYALPNACQDFFVTTACLRAGTYYAFMAPQFTNPVNCPARYWMTLSAEPGCLPQGACCLGSGQCVPDQTQNQCTASNGTWQGEGTVCDPNPCNTLGACCYPDGSCQEVPSVDCTGHFYGPNTVCGDVSCLGACCYADGTCTDTAQNDCSGAFQGVGTTCATTVCPIPGPGDMCQDAIPVGNVTNLPCDTTTATFDGPGGCMTGPNLWFCYTATSHLTYFGLCGSTFDTMLAVYDGCTCWGPLLGCNDDSCGLQSELTLPTVPGQQCLVEVGGYASHVGAGVLTIHPATCGDFNADGQVTADDYWMLADAFGTCVGNPKYVVEVDLDGDGCITLVDYQTWLVCYRNANGGKDFVRPTRKSVTPMPTAAQGHPRPMGPMAQ